MHVNLKELTQYVEDKFISLRKHPTQDLFIWNYTDKTQYSWHWDEITMMARGLITDSEGNVISKSFSKFFGVSDHSSTKLEVLPAELPLITEKVDGSLISVVNYKGTLVVASRGAFESDQAIHATEWLKQKGITKIPEGRTYAFEWLAPDNQIVIQHVQSKLVLLTVFNIGEIVTERPREWVEAEGRRLEVEVVRTFDFPTFAAIRESLKTMNGSIQEGFVVRYSNGLRVKMKCETYIKLHKIMTQESVTTIWEELVEKGNVDSIIESVPKEFADWVSKEANAIIAQREEIMKISRELAKEVELMPTRKEQALHIIGTLKSKEKPNIKSVAFSLLDGDEKEANRRAWKLVCPEGYRTFSEKPWKNKLVKLKEE